MFRFLALALPAALLVLAAVDAGAAALGLLAALQRNDPTGPIGQSQP